MRKAITVSQLTLYLESLFKRDVHLQGLLVKGQVVNLKKAHFLYFDLRDETSLIHCVSFDRSLDRSIIQEGMEFLVTGSLALYKAGGIYQIRVTGIHPIGQAADFLELMALKKKLAKEGLFNPDRKRPLKVYPRGIGLISSASGAVLHDFCNEVNFRYPLVPVYFAPASVQGQAASKEIIHALRDLVTFSAQKPIDVVVIARGGGSGQDLSCFNEEALVRAIARSPIPVVTAIGHQVDTSLSDLVADRRASTPTEAASLVTPDRLQILQEVDGWLTRAQSQTLEMIHQRRRNLFHLQQRSENLHPRVQIHHSLLTLNRLQTRLNRLMQDQLDQKRGSLNQLKTLAYDRYEKVLENKNQDLCDRTTWSLFHMGGDLVKGDEEVNVDKTYLLKSMAYTYRVAIEKKEKNDPDD